MRFLLDMNLPPALADRLRAEGHDAIHVLDAGLGNLPDRAIFEQAAEDRRIVVTFDLDFGEIAGFAGPGNSSIILLRLRSARQLHLLDRLRVAIARVGDALQTGAILLVEDSRVRVRRTSPEE